MTTTLSEHRNGKPGAANRKEVSEQSLLSPAMLSWKHFGATFATLREKHHFPQAYIAQEAYKRLALQEITADELQSWEEGRSLPSEAQYRALEGVLIFDNDKIANPVQESTRFLAHYEAAKLTFETEEYYHGSIRHGFGLLLRQYRGHLSGSDLAEIVNQRPTYELAPGEKNRLKTEWDRFLAAIEAGEVRPSRGDGASAGRSAEHAPG